MVLTSLFSKGKHREIIASQVNKDTLKIRKDNCILLSQNSYFIFQKCYNVDMNVDIFAIRRKKMNKLTTFRNFDVFFFLRIARLGLYLAVLNLYLIVFSQNWIVRLICVMMSPMRQD